MKAMFALFFCLFGASSAWEFIRANGENLQFAHQNVFDWMKILTNPELYALISQQNVQWPTYDVIPPPSFNCADKTFPGFYADPATQCQTFHRCDINGNLTSYICVNRTVFNPITLICDQWFNVDCDAFVKDEYFANRRLYTSLPLFGGSDAAPPAGPNGQWQYVQAASSAANPAASNAAVANVGGVRNSAAKPAAVRPPVRRPAAVAVTTAAAVEPVEASTDAAPIDNAPVAAPVDAAPGAASPDAAAAGSEISDVGAI